MKLHTPPHVYSYNLSVVACKKHVNKKIFTTFLIATMLCCLGVVWLPNDASARIRNLTDWLANKDNMGFYVGSDGSQHSMQGTTTCASLKGSNTKPNYKNCSSRTINGKVCYYNCTCPSSYSQTCTSPMVGSDGPCDGKYVSCSCPATYTLTCSGAGQAPNGSPCNGKYAACKCDSSWVSCVEGLGNGSACTYNGVKYYASCKTEESGNGAHYDEDGGELIFGPNNYTLFEGPLFDGQGNTDAIRDAAKAVTGDPAVAYAAEAYATDKTRGYGYDGSKHFGRGMWYLPALGEVMEMYGAEWKRLVYDLKGSAPDIVDKLKHIIDFPNEETWFDAYYTADTSDKIREAENKLKAKGVDSLYLIDDEYIWTSNTVDAFPTPDGDFWVYAKRDKGIRLHPQSKLTSVLPVTLLEIPIIDGILPKVGDVITLDLRYGDAANFDDPKDIAGIIYWRMRQSGGTVRVRVRALTLAVREKVVFKEGENFAVPEVPDEPFTGVNLSDASLCDAKFKWTEANCVEALKGELGGEICDLDGEEKYTECIIACPVINDYEQFTGPLFDGMSNTQLMKEVYSSNPAIEILDWQPDWAGDLHEQLQASHWYIPSLGEALTMTGCNDISAFRGSLSNILDVSHSGRCDLDKASEFRDRITVAADGIHKNYLCDLIFTSQEISTEEVISCEIGSCHIHPRNEPIENWTVAALVEGDFAGAEYGDYLYADLHFSKDMEDDKYIGLIYWVSPDGSKARVVSRYLYLSSGGAPWTGTGDVNSDAMVDDPFECDTGNTGSSTGGGGTSCSYTYTSSNCLFPRELKGATCTKDGTTYYEKCSCLAEGYTPYQLIGCDNVSNAGDIIGYNNTQKMLAAGSQAAEYVTNYHPSGIAANNSWFGAGNWFITALKEDYVAIGRPSIVEGVTSTRDWNNYSQCGVYRAYNGHRYMTSCDISDKEYIYSVPDGAGGHYNKDSIVARVAPVTVLKCSYVAGGTWDDLNYKLLYSDMSVGYDANKTPIGYIRGVYNGYLTIIALDYGENLTWSDDMSAKITDECGSF